MSRLLLCCLFLTLSGCSTTMVRSPGGEDVSENTAMAITGRWRDFTGDTIQIRRNDNGTFTHAGQHTADKIEESFQVRKFLGKHVVFVKDTSNGMYHFALLDLEDDAAATVRLPNQAKFSELLSKNTIRGRESKSGIINSLFIESNFTEVADAISNADVEACFYPDAVKLTKIKD